MAGEMAVAAKAESVKQNKQNKMPWIEALRRVAIFTLPNSVPFIAILLPIELILGRSSAPLWLWRCKPQEENRDRSRSRRIARPGAQIRRQAAGAKQVRRRRHACRACGRRRWSWRRRRAAADARIARPGPNRRADRSSRSL